MRAIVNHAGYDTLDPQAPSMPMMRQNLGGSPDATRAYPDALARAFDSSEQLRAMSESVKADHDGAQGPGYWKTLFAYAEGCSFVPVRASLGTPEELRIL